MELKNWIGKSIINTPHRKMKKNPLIIQQRRWRWWMCTYGARFIGICKPKPLRNGKVRQRKGASLLGRAKQQRQYCHLLKWVFEALLSSLITNCCCCLCTNIDGIFSEILRRWCLLLMAMANINLSECALWPEVWCAASGWSCRANSWTEMN